MHYVMHHVMHYVMHYAMQVRRTLAQCEGELAWLVYIIATVLGSHLTPNSNSETQQLVDGDLTCVHRTIVSTIEP